MAMQNRIAEDVRTLPPSGIRRFFDIAADMEDVISLGIGEPDFPTPAHVARAGGTMLSVEHGLLFLAHTAYGDRTVLDCGPLAEGSSSVHLAMGNPGGLVWNASVNVDGTTAAEAPGLVSLMAMAPFEGIDVGVDRRSPVSWDVYERHGPFPYSGRLEAVTYRPGELAPDAGSLWLDYIKANGTRYE